MPAWHAAVSWHRVVWLGVSVYAYLCAAQHWRVQSMTSRQLSTILAGRWGRVSDWSQQVDPGMLCAIDLHAGAAVLRRKRSA